MQKNLKQRKTTNIARHSKPSFDEDGAVYWLAQFLEKGQKIKTFFKSNDRTPNQDGFFELCDNTQNIPQKQFIVQIKGTKNIPCLSSGKNKGKYKYVLSTQFLYYVKEKVTENPAIYFVVDTTNNRIFWLYLSDENLMKLDFEGKEKISYYFSEEEICNDIEKFLKEIKVIVSKRNQIFVQKKPEEIAEIQDAIYYLNNLFDNDLKFIKDMVFPNLWRFGIANTKLPQNELSITIENQTITNTTKSNLFQIYPQEKGINDSGIREVSEFFNGINFYNYIDTTGTTPPMAYIKDVISQILKKFFDNPFIINFMPKKIISEILSEFVINFENSMGIKIGTKISKIEKSLNMMAKYFLYLLENDSLSKNENKLKQNLNLNIYNQQTSFISYSINPFDILYTHDCIGYFKSFYTKHINESISKKQPYPFIIEYLDKEFLEYFFAINRAKNIGMNKITHSKIEKPHFIYGSTEDKYCEVRNFCKIWFSDLERIYAQIYKTIFRDNKYLNSGKYKYEIKKPAINDIVWCVRKYNNKNFLIEESTTPIEYSDIGVLTSITLITFINNNKTLYNSLKALIYQGISKALGLQCEGVDLGYIQNTIFNI